MLRAYIRWLACLGGVVEESTGRTRDHLPKRSDGPTILRQGLTTSGGKRVNFTMSKHYESCTNATGSENCEPGRLNHRNRTYGHRDTVVHSIDEKTGLSGERSPLKPFGSRERKQISVKYAFPKSKAHSDRSRTKMRFP